MAMHNKGLSKLTEEFGEVLQTVGKLNAYPDGNHPDEKGDLYERLENELADSLAAITFVIRKLKLNTRGISLHAAMKLGKYNKWDEENDEARPATT